MAKSPRRHYHKGAYTPENPKKYIGKKNFSVYRSSWELKFCQMCDRDPRIVQWCSECVVVPYQFRGKSHRYYTDFLIVMEDKRRIVIEIKPSRETKPPRQSKKKSHKTMLYEGLTYAKNMAKWDAAQTFCGKRGWEFRVVTEKSKLF